MRVCIKTSRSMYGARFNVFISDIRRKAGTIKKKRNQYSMRKIAIKND